MLKLEKDITRVVHVDELSVHLRVDSNDDHMILAHGYVSDLILPKLVCPSEGISGRDFLFSVARSRQVEKLGHLVIHILDMVAQKTVSTTAPDPNVAFAVDCGTICGVASHHLWVHGITF